MTKFIKKLCSRFMKPAALRGEVHDIPFKDPLHQLPGNALKSHREINLSAYSQQIHLFSGLSGLSDDGIWIQNFKKNGIPVTIYSPLCHLVEDIRASETALVDSEAASILKPSEC